MMLTSLLVLAFVGSSSAFFLNTKADKWDGLKVHWGANPFSSDNFVHMPRTTKDALDKGFKKISDCDVNANWRGARYVKNDDLTLVLLFDVNGYIAGIQTTVPSGEPSGYPSTHEQPPFVKDGDNWVLSAYFVDPAIVCKGGRSAEEFKKHGTGTNLYIQNGTNVETSYIQVPHQESDIGKTKWTKGKCFYTMGMHYWYDVSADMNCDDFFPVFLMYNSGELTGFGWSMAADLTSNRLEHPGSSVLNFFFQEVPKCFANVKTFSTMHVYLTDSYFTNLKC